MTPVNELWALRTTTPSPILTTLLGRAPSENVPLKLTVPPAADESATSLFKVTFPEYVVKPEVLSLPRTAAGIKLAPVVALPKIRTSSTRSVPVTPTGFAGDAGAAVINHPQIERRSSS